MDNFSFCYKGDRDYVHGSDIYNSVTKYLEEKYSTGIGRSDLSIHRLSIHNMVGQVLENSGQAVPTESSVVFQFEVSGRVLALFMLETDAVVQCRYEYDEDSVTQLSRVEHDHHSISVRNQTPYTPIEIIIALNKKLMQTVFAAENGKWLFTRLSLKRRLPTNSDRLFVITHLGGHGPRLTRSSIDLDGVDYGEIYFSMRRK